VYLTKRRIVPVEQGRLAKLKESAYAGAKAGRVLVARFFDRPSKGVEQRQDPAGDQVRAHGRG